MIYLGIMNKQDVPEAIVLTFIWLKVKLDLLNHLLPLLLLMIAKTCVWWKDMDFLIFFNFIFENH